MEIEDEEELYNKIKKKINKTIQSKLTKTDYNQK